MILLRLSCLDDTSVALEVKGIMLLIDVIVQCNSLICSGGSRGGSLEPTSLPPVLNIL